jgi:hypothetical protein
MDYTYTKPKMWANAIGAILFYFFSAYELHSRLTGHYKGISYLLFLFLAVNCTYRVYNLFFNNPLRARRKSKARSVDSHLVGQVKVYTGTYGKR